MYPWCLFCFMMSDFRMCFLLFSWQTVVGSLMSSDAVRWLETHLTELDMAMLPMQNIWVSEVHHMDSLAQAKKILQGLVESWNSKLEREFRSDILVWCNIPVYSVYDSPLHHILIYPANNCVQTQLRPLLIFHFQMWRFCHVLMFFRLESVYYLQPPIVHIVIL